MAIRGRVASAALILAMVLLLLPVALSVADAAGPSGATPAGALGIHKIVDGLHEPVFLTSTGHAGPPRLALPRWSPFLEPIPAHHDAHPPTWRTRS